MDFAKKQLEKFGWKEGSGLGKSNQGISQAIKPSLKVGKGGMGFDLSKELVDTWWTRAYDDSLNKINIETNEGTCEIVGVSLREDDISQTKSENGNPMSSHVAVERPFEKMKKRMMKATFTTFSKGGTLSNGEMITDALAANKPESDSSVSDDGNKSQKCRSTELKTLTDEELFLACGGRTAHKAARFGLKLNGKLARIAAQEEAAKVILSKSHKLRNKSSNSYCYSDSEHNVTDDKPPVMSEVSVRLSSQEYASTRRESGKEKRKKKKKKLKQDDVEDAEITHPTLSEEMADAENTMSHQSDLQEADLENTKRKRKKHKKRKQSDLDEVQKDIDALSDEIHNPKIVLEDDSIVKKSNKKKSKKLKLS